MQYMFFKISFCNDLHWVRMPPSVKSVSNSNRVMNLTLDSKHQNGKRTKDIAREEEMNCGQIDHCHSCI